MTVLSYNKEIDHSIFNKEISETLRDLIESIEYDGTDSVITFSTTLTTQQQSEIDTFAGLHDKSLSHLKVSLNERRVFHQDLVDENLNDFDVFDIEGEIFLEN